MSVVLCLPIASLLGPCHEFLPHEVVGEERVTKPIADCTPLFKIPFQTAFQTEHTNSTSMNKKLKENCEEVVYTLLTKWELR